MNEYSTIAIELGLGFIALLIYTRILGKTHISQLTPFDFISALILGELLGNAVYDKDININKILFATALWGVLILATTFLTLKFKGIRKILEGEPSIVVHKGQIKYDVLKKNKMDLNQLQGLIRQQGFFSMREVEYAVMETNGQISVLPKSGHDVPKANDLNLPPKEVHLAVELIIDGELVRDNLKEAGVDEAWLKNELSRQNISNYKEVLYAEYIKDKPLFINKYIS